MTLDKRSLFQILIKVQANGRIQEDWGTAFCVNSKEASVLVTARHVFMVAKLGPLLKISIRAEGEDWMLSPVDIQIVSHPVADLCLIYAPSGFGRELVPLNIKTLSSLKINSTLETVGFLGTTRHETLLKAPDKLSGKLTDVASTVLIGDHRLTTGKSNIAEHLGLSGSPIFEAHSGEVVGIYSHGFGKGTVVIDAAHIHDI